MQTVRGVDVCGKKKRALDICFSIMMMASSLALGACAAPVQESGQTAEYPGEHPVALLEPSVDTLSEYDNNGVSDVYDVPAAPAPLTSNPYAEMSFEDAEFAVFGASAQVGDRVEFGIYAQDADSDTSLKPIQWRVVSVSAEARELALISEYVLDCAQYSYSTTDINNWEKSDLKAWLETDFASVAFSEGELTCISELRVPTVEEVRLYFPSSEERICEPTPYAISQGAIRHRGTGGCLWWLRESPSRFDIAAVVLADGAVDCYRWPRSYENVGVRPLLVLEL